MNRAAGIYLMVALMLTLFRFPAYCAVITGFADDHGQIHITYLPNGFDLVFQRRIVVGQTAGSTVGQHESGKP